MAWGGFSGVLQKLVPHRSLPIWLRIRGDIRNRKMTPDSASRWLSDSAFECLKENSASWRVGTSPTRWVRELPTPRLVESESRQLSDSTSWGVAVSPTRRVGVFLWWVGESLFKFFKIYHHFKQLNQPFKRSIWQKEARDVMYYHHWFI